MAFCKFRLFRVEIWIVWTFLGTELPLAYIGIKTSYPFPCGYPKAILP